jgi:hypothetical protein
MMCGVKEGFGGFSVFSRLFWFVFKASWVSNPLWSPQWEGVTSDSQGIPNEGGGTVSDCLQERERLIKTN